MAFLILAFTEYVFVLRLEPHGNEVHVVYAKS